MRLSRWLWVGPAVLIILLPFGVNSFYLDLTDDIGISTLVCLGLTLLTGAGGMTSFGQAALMGVGAYATAVATTTYGLSPWLGLLFSLALSGGVAWILGLITLRLSGHYLAILSIAWGMAIYLLFGSLTSLGRHGGINQIPPLSAFGVSLLATERYHYLIWLSVGAALWASSNLLTSRKGRAIQALRGGRVLVASVGIDEFSIRVSTFVFAAMLAGLAGWLYAHKQRYVGPTPFDLSAGVQFLLMAVIGGAGRVSGALVGAAVVTALGTVLQDLLPLFTSRAANLESIAFGCVFILLLQHARSGLVGLLGRSTQSRAGPRRSTVAALAQRPLPAPGVLLLQLRGLTKRFGGLVAVDDVGFDVASGEIVGLVGPNGAGKSTTFDLVSGARAASAGEITFCSRPIQDLPANRRAASGMARTYQHVKLRPAMTLLENVMLGAYARTGIGWIGGALRLDRSAEEQVVAEATAQLRRVGLDARALDLAGSLPLGQQRMLEIARALAADPLILMLDEPAAGLRRAEKQQLRDLLQELRASGVAVLLVEHDMEFVMGLVDRIVVLNFGKKIAEGSPSEIRANRHVQDAYLGGRE